jgi:hypothetical protein
VRLISGAVVLDLGTEWLQFALLSPIFNEILAFDLKHKNKTK